MQVLRIVAAAGVLVVLIVVLATPSVYYPPVQRTILFLLASLLIGLLVAAEAGTQFRLDMKWFAFVTGGSAAIVIFLCWWLTHLAQPDFRIAVYKVVDEKGDLVDLNWKGAYELSTMPNGAKANPIVQGNEIALIYNEQQEQQELRVRKTPNDPWYTGTISFFEVRQYTLTFGKELKRANP
jgi:hypothetical protein